MCNEQPSKNDNRLTALNATFLNYKRRTENDGKCMSGRYWLLTIPHAHFLPYLPPNVAYLKGQLETGEQGFVHWQLLASFNSTVRLSGVKRIFGDQAHCELSRSAAADAYVHKDDTAVANTRFELGARPTRRNRQTDWDAVLQSAKSGDFTGIDSDILIRCYSSIKSIAKDNLSPGDMERTVVVYHGPTGTGKSRRAWNEATFSAYPKIPTNIWWDGYRPNDPAHENVVIDEFRGEINISHVLRWFDRYPVVVEAKHGAVALCAKRIWITSNIAPQLWYANRVDPETIEALLRRLTVVEIAE
uniref:Putative replication-associated protein n=1 Tax=uncultured virus TaxID=340016 RepID=A0A2H4YQ47_9VIRU|nr:putative replication-associated protein [uncultured virus]